jgi:hypothetical protein
MKYMFLWYCDEQAWENLSQTERRQIIERGMAQLRPVEESGKLLGGSPLRSSSAATTIRTRNDRSIVTDGPFAETREQLGGYNLIDARDLDEAIDIGKRLYGGPPFTLEIRPVMDTCE